MTMMIRGFCKKILQCGKALGVLVDETNCSWEVLIGFALARDNHNKLESSKRK